MRLTDKQLREIWVRVMDQDRTETMAIAYGRAILAAAAVTGETPEYEGRERRGFEVSTPGELR